MQVGAPVARQREPERLERGHQPGLLEIARHGLGAGRQRGLDGRGHAQPARDRVPCQQAGTDHHGRVRGVGARRDRGDPHGARPDGRPLAADLDLDRAVGAPIHGGRIGDHRLRGRRGLAPRVGRRERRGVRRRERLARGFLDLGLRVGRRLEAVRVVRPEVLAERLQRDAVLRPPRPGHGRLDAREVEGETLVEVRPVAGHPPQPLLPGVALDEPDVRRGPPGEPQVGQRLVVDGEEGRGRPELGAHVADRRPVGERQAREPVAGELDERPDDPVPSQHLGHDQHEVGRGRAARQLAGQVHADDMRHRLVERLAQQHGLGLDAADAVAQHAERVDHGRMGVGADDRVGKGHRPVRVRPLGDDRREELEVDLVDDAGPRRDDPQVAEGRLGPAQELVALDVALVLALHVVGECALAAEAVDLHRVIDHEVRRHERVDQRRVAAEVRHRVAHDREVDDRGHAGQVLEDHARGHERDLGLGGATRVATRSASPRRRRGPSPRRRGGGRSRAGS